MKINSARTFVARRCKSLDMPRARPVNSMTRATPSATPATLTSVRMGRWRMFEVTRLSICNKFLTDLYRSIPQPQIFADERRLQSAFTGKDPRQRNMAQNVKLRRKSSYRIDKIFHDERIILY